MAKLFLGLDSSTQSLSAVVIDLDTRKVVYEKSLNFDQALPQFKTQNGVLPNRDPLVKHSSPLLWAAALDLLFAQMKKDGVALGKILAVSGSGQQHGSVYLNEKAAARWRIWTPKNRWSKISTAFSRARPRPSGWIPRPRRNAPRSARNSAASNTRRRAPARTRSSGSPARRSASFTRPSRRPTTRPPASRWSVRSWRRCSPAKSRRLILATARA